MWQAAGGTDAAKRAGDKAHNILADHKPLGFTEDMEKFFYHRYQGIKKV